MTNTLFKASVAFVKEHEWLGNEYQYTCPALRAAALGLSSVCGDSHYSNATLPMKKAILGIWESIYRPGADAYKGGAWLFPVEHFYGIGYAKELREMMLNTVYYRKKKQQLALAMFIDITALSYDEEYPNTFSYFRRA